MAFHDLTSRLTPPRNLRSLLGLNLKFVPNPRKNVPWETFQEQILPRFDRDLKVKVFMASAEDDGTYNPKIYVTSTWTPHNRQIPEEIQSRLDDFKAAVRLLVKPRRCPSNLLWHQEKALKLLRNQNDFLITQCDKNLGPAIIERDEYIKMALQDHLLDRSTYRRLSTLEARMYHGQLKIRLGEWLKKHRGVLSKNEDTFLNRSLQQNKDPFGAFYLLMKVHKTPLASRAIISGSGSLLHPLGVWVDSKLQPLAQRRAAYFKSSQELKVTLDQLDIPPGCQLFTADAVSMYTNIPTNHALDLICNHIQATAREFSGVPVRALCEALKIVMKWNIFSFGDTYWKQETGTAMGTPPAPPWANLYYSICEEQFLSRFDQNLVLYKRFIDDVLGIWKPSTDDDWTSFQLAMNDESFGLRWIVSTRSSKVDFMDLTLTLQDDKIVTTLFEKPSNHHLYIPPNSCHPPGLLRGMVHGMLNRIYTLCSNEDDQRHRTIVFYRHLQRRGYQPKDLNPLFSRAIAKAKNLSWPASQPVRNLKGLQFFHLEFHPKNPLAHEIQSAWTHCIANPPNKPPLQDLKNAHGDYIKIDRMIVAFHRPPNLGNLLSYRRIKPNSGPPVSEFIS